jgi:hypothetical protein
MMAGLSQGIAQQTTEQFIPIGMSPGVSNRLSYLGPITSIDASAKTVTLFHDNANVTLRITPSTRIWLDRSSAKKPNIDGAFGDLESGRRIEAMRSQADENTAAWIKIESP